MQRKKSIIVGGVLTLFVIILTSVFFYYKYSYKETSQIKSDKLVSDSVKQSIEDQAKVSEQTYQEFRKVLTSIESLYKQLNTTSLVVGTFDNHLKLTEASNLNHLKTLYSNKYSINFDENELYSIDKNTVSVIFKLYNPEKTKVATVVGKYYIKDKQLEIESVYGELTVYGSPDPEGVQFDENKVRELEEKLRKEKENKGNE